MNKQLASIAVAIILNGHSAFAASTDLMGIYQQALANDPIFKQAYSTYMASKEALPQAVANLLPTLSGNASYSKRYTDSRNNVIGTPVKDNFDELTWGINLTQPVFNVAAWLTVGQANYSVKQALATFNASAQDLILRTSEAYFAVLLASDTLRFSKAKQRANSRQLDQAEQRFKVGLDAITSVYEAQAAFDSSNAEVISAQNNLINQRENLRQITNHTYKKLSPLRSGRLPLMPPNPKKIDDWVEVALKQNYALISSKYAAMAAKHTIGIQFAGHLPSVNFTGNFTKAKNNADAAVLSTNRDSYAFGVNLSLPIYQGGLVVSQTRQARHNYQLASDQLSGAHRSAIVNTRIAFNTITDGINKIKADRQAIRSAQNSLDSTSAQFKVGTRTMVDVVNAQQNLFQTQTILAQDQYGYINAVLRLKFFAGTLNANDLQEINAWLASNRASRKLKHQRDFLPLLKKTAKAARIAREKAMAKSYIATSPAFNTTKKTLLATKKAKKATLFSSLANKLFKRPATTSAALPAKSKAVTSAKKPTLIGKEHLALPQAKKSPQHANKKPATLKKVAKPAVKQAFSVPSLKTTRFS